MKRTLNIIVILLFLSLVISCNSEKLELGNVEVWDTAMNLHNEEVKFYFLGLQSLGVDYKIYLSNHANDDITELELDNNEGYDTKFITLKSSLLTINSIKVDIQNINMITIRKDYGLKYCIVLFDELNSKIDVHIVFRNSPPNLYILGDKYKLNKSEPKN